MFRQFIITGMNKRLLRWFLVLINMIVIFMFSAQNGQESGQVSGFVGQLMEKIIIAKWFFQVIPLRKAAHFTIYFLLGILVIRALWLHKNTLRQRVVTAAAFCFLYACSDEFHQSFVPGRAASIRDVLIDTSGALTGIIVLLVLINVRRVTK